MTGPPLSRDFPQPGIGSPKIVVAILLLVVYGWYVKGHFEADPDVDAEDLAPLRFHRLDFLRRSHRAVHERRDRKCEAP